MSETSFLLLLLKLYEWETTSCKGVKPAVMSCSNWEAVWEAFLLAHRACKCDFFAVGKSIQPLQKQIQKLVDWDS